MVNRFTPKAQVVLSSAKKNAEKMGHSYIGSEHLILGILSTECVAKKILEDKKILFENVYEMLVEIAGVGSYAEIGATELTPKCKKIIESSSNCAKRFSSKLIGSEHILYAICEDGESVGARIIISLGINVQILKNEIATFLDTSSTDDKGDKFAISGAPVLSQYGKNLNSFAKMGKCDPVIGRETELERLIQTLSRRTKNNPCLIGEPGVGKTAIIEGLAQRIVNSEVPEDLLGKIIVSLDLSSMIAGAKYRGEFEERMRGVMNEIKNNDSIILFIDEIHAIIGAGAAEGAVDAASIIKPALARGQMQLIGATTTQEYRKHIEKDPALERRFQPIFVKEPTEKEAITILEGLKGKYEDFHKVKISPDAIKSAVTLSVRYINDRFLPDKAIDLIDEACSKIRMRSFFKEPEIKLLEANIQTLSQEKERAILSENFELASKIRAKELQCIEKLNNKKQLMQKSARTASVVTKGDIEEIITQWTSIPVSQIGEKEALRVSQLYDILSERVIGQENAIRVISSSIKRGKAGLKRPNRPIGSYLLLGPTGVGKTHLVKCISETIFGSKDSLIKLDMSEYMEKHSVSKLIGSPPGYVGYDEGGQLTERVRLKPYSVILFDEIEKAHKDVYNILLQILEDGTLTDSQGRRIDFKNTIIFLTSNIGAKSISEPKLLGFTNIISKNAEMESTKSSINEALRHEFNPEFLNRLDEVVIFNKLSHDDTKKIAKIMLYELIGLGKDIGLNLQFENSVIDYIGQVGYDKLYGARPLRRAITTYIENPLSEKILKGEVKKGDTVLIIYQNQEIEFKIEKRNIGAKPVPF